MEGGWSHHSQPCGDRFTTHELLTIAHDWAGEMMADFETVNEQQDRYHLISFRLAR